MQIEMPHNPPKAIDLLPLINVVFLLILFVLIAGRPTTQHPSGIEVPQSTQDTPYQAGALAVRLTHHNEFFIGLDGPKSVAEIAAYLQQQNFAELPIELVADGRAQAHALLAFRRALAEVGIGEIRLKTRYVADAVEGADE